MTDLERRVTRLEEFLMLSTEYEREEEIRAEWEAEHAAREAQPDPFPPTGLEPRGCPIPGACACPATEGQAAELPAEPPAPDFEAALLEAARDESERHAKLHGQVYMRADTAAVTNLFRRTFTAGWNAAIAYAMQPSKPQPNPDEPFFFVDTLPECKMLAENMRYRFDSTLQKTEEAAEGMLRWLLDVRGWTSPGAAARPAPLPAVSVERLAAELLIARTGGPDAEERVRITEESLLNQAYFLEGAGAMREARRALELLRPAPTQQHEKGPTT